MIYFLGLSKYYALHKINPENFTAEQLSAIIETLNTIQWTWSKKLQPERLGSMIRLLYVFRYPNATSDETEEALVSIYYICNN